MKAIRKKPGCASEIIEVDNTLAALQTEVGGYIETVPIASDAVIICNEEGRILGLPYNCRFFRRGFRRYGAPRRHQGRRILRHAGGGLPDGSLEGGQGMNLSNSVDKKKAKNLLKLFRKTIPVMTLMDAYAIQAILHGAERRAKEREDTHDD